MSKRQKLTKNQIIITLHSLKDELENNYGVRQIGLVGSYAREEHTEDSDIDFLVEFSKVNFNNLAGLSLYLEKVFEKKADIIIKSPYLRKKFLDSVEKEATYA
jgi:predicted nucleotidyltransferase